MTTDCEHLYVDRVGTDDRVARITLNRPEKLNALAAQTFGEFHHTLRELEADETARVIIVRGAGRAFSVGHDLSGLDLTASPSNPERTFRVADDRNRPLTINFATGLRESTDIMMYFWNMAKITIVQAHGYCIAGGMELAMMGDLVTTSEDCLFGHPGHRNLGVARNAMLLPLIIGMRKAKELFYTGDHVNGIEALHLGLVNYAWPAAELEERTIALADRVANQSSDFLAVLKMATNKFYENMGAQSSVNTATTLDGLIQNTESVYAWDEIYRNEGLKAAVAWRDGPYGDYGFAKSKPDSSATETL
ncbi:MAG TPA: enoyl-CoA hydratase-related protein [Acidimicrobiales bacterium]|jgi:enoyl-CoA hydratase|nr:enoyl-CoA hydratase-related protein [Acidimicrobiales bacterium]